MKESKPRILIVEDQLELHRLLHLVFEGDGRFHVDISSNAIESLKLAFDNYYSAFLFDLRNEYSPDHYDRFIQATHIAERVRRRYPYSAIAYYCYDNCVLADDHAQEINAVIWSNHDTSEIGLPSKIAALLEQNKNII